MTRASVRLNRCTDWSAHLLYLGATKPGFLAARPKTMDSYRDHTCFFMH